MVIVVVAIIAFSFFVYALCVISSVIEKSPVQELRIEKFSSQARALTNVIDSDATILFFRVWNGQSEFVPEHGRR